MSDAIRHALYSRMSDISEACWCAGWMSGTEYALWLAVTTGEPCAWGVGIIEQPDIEALRELAGLAGGWWRSGAEYEPEFVELDEWRAQYAEREVGAVTGRRDGTGTGVWTHPAAEPEQRRCECGQSEFDGRVWSWRGVGTRRVCVANSTLSGYCPSCGCRLSVVDGEPRVGEPYADLERDAKRFRAVAANVDDAAAYAYLQIGEHALRSSLRVRQEGIFEGLRKAVAIIQEHRGGETDEHDA